MSAKQNQKRIKKGLPRDFMRFSVKLRPNKILLNRETSFELQAAGKMQFEQLWFQPYIKSYFLYKYKSDK